MNKLWIALKKMYLYTLKQHTNTLILGAAVVNRFKKNVSLHVETTQAFVKWTWQPLWIALKKMYLYTLKQQRIIERISKSVVNRFKKNVSLHVETTCRKKLANEWRLWIALKKMYLYTLKQPNSKRNPCRFVVNRFKKNVSLHVETTPELKLFSQQCCESL